MARPGPSTAELATLRAITYRLSTTSTAHLPQQIPTIIASLANCKSLLSTAYTTGTQATSDASVAIHKYRTLLSTLLQDRTVQGRWSAIVLIKATIEVGGWETLSKSLPWVRGLLGVLSKPDPLSSKKLVLITLTRIFILTREYATLVREITTPNMPAYIGACLQFITSKSAPSLVVTILESFNQLLPRHPTIFRTYTKQIVHILGKILAPTPSSTLSGSGLEASAEVSEAARRLYVQLPCCAPKGAASQNWDNAMKDAVKNTHRIADKVFRAVVEDWKSSNNSVSAPVGHTLDTDIQDLEKDSMNLAPWSGIYAGGERLTGLLRLIRECLANPTPGSVNLHVGLIMDLVMRMFSLTVPTSGSASTNNARFNNQVSKEERENLWAILPQVHVETMEVVLALTTRLAGNASALDLLVLDQLLWVFGSEKDNVQIRTGCYRTVAQVLKRSGLTLPKSSIDSLAIIIRRCCDDILPSDSAAVMVAKQAVPQAKVNGVKQQQVSANADTFLNASLSSNDPTAEYLGLRDAAHQFLPVLLANIRPQLLSDSLRTRMDRTAILTKHKDAMIASVLNPPPSKKFGKPAASILPLLVRSFADEKGVESLLRPRMPVVRTGARDADSDDDMEDEDEEEEEEEEAEEEDEHFVGEELDALLEKDDVMTDAPIEHVAHRTLPVSDISAQTASPSSIKRLQTDDTPLSPAKRVKTAVEEDDESDFQIPAAVTIKSSSLSVAATLVSQPARPSGIVAPVISLEDSGDDEDDDFGGLVMGEDSDDESDA